MHRLSAPTLWYANEAVVSFFGMLAFTVTAVYYVTKVGMSPLELVLVGTLADAVGQWTGGPAIGLIGNAFSIRAALASGALCMAPALALYRRAARHLRLEME